MTIVLKARDGSENLEMITKPYKLLLKYRRLTSSDVDVYLPLDTVWGMIKVAWEVDRFISYHTPSNMVLNVTFRAWEEKPSISVSFDYENSKIVQLYDPEVFRESLKKVWEELLTRKK